MNLPFLSPLFDMRYGAPWIIQVIAVAGAVVTILWMRHVMAGEGEYRSFRATATQTSPLVRIGVGLLVASIALWLVAPAILQLNGLLNP